MLQKMGYTWNGKAWIRGNVEAYKAQRAVARSGNRFIRFINADGESTSPPEAVAASQRFQQAVQKARQEVMPSQSKEEVARDRDFKNWLQKREAPIVWLGVQLACFAVLSLVSIPLASGGPVSVHWNAEFQKFVQEPLLITSLGVTAGLVLTKCRESSRMLLPGVEELDGKTERILADAMDGNFALPAPNHIRYSSTNWKLFVTLGEAISAINVSLVMNGVLQPLLIRWSSDTLVWRLVDATSNSFAGQYIALVGAWGTALIVALPAALRVRQALAGEPFDGIVSECQGVLRANQTAGAYFNMNTPKDADPIQTTRAFQVLVDGWMEAFDGVVDGAQWKLSLLAYDGSLACAVAWQLSGGSLVAPCIARMLTAVVTYNVLDEEESCRASVLLPTYIIFRG